MRCVARLVCFDIAFNIPFLISSISDSWDVQAACSIQFRVTVVQLKVNTCAHGYLVPVIANQLSILDPEKQRGCDIKFWPCV
jgi:hypothetical protein